MEAINEHVGLTRRQKDCLDAIRLHIEANGVSPTMEELRVRLGCASKGHVGVMVQALVERGKITLVKNRPRSIALIGGTVGYPLPPKTAEALRQYCAATGEDAAAIVADAVALFLDEVEPPSLRATA